MPTPENPDHASPEAGAPAAFPKTRWSVVLDAQENDPAALATLCGAYWYPLYSYARRMGIAEAEDLTQSFFERLLLRDVLAHARRERGKLRNFLLRSLTNFAAEEWRKRGAQKRGSGQPALEFDALSAKERYALEPHDATTPELEYERAWAREILRQALDKLGAAYKEAGNDEVFGALRDQLVEGSTDQSYESIAASLGMTEGSIRFAAFKLRQRYRAALREIVAETVTGMEEVEAELAHLRTLFQH
jgi:RNA polymerase sigma-70 factor (ECF subfamily)